MNKFHTFVADAEAQQAEVKIDNQDIEVFILDLMTPE